MSKFYGTVHGDASQTDGTRRGFRSIKVAAQSYDGSVITSMHYGHNDELMVDLSFSDNSSTYGQSIFYGTLDELKAKLSENEKPVEVASDAFMDAFDQLSCLLNKYEVGEDGMEMGSELYSALCEMHRNMAAKIN